MLKTKKITVESVANGDIDATLHKKEFARGIGEMLTMHNSVALTTEFLFIEDQMFDNNPKAKDLLCVLGNRTPGKPWLDKMKELLKSNNSTILWGECYLQQNEDKSLSLILKPEKGNLKIKKIANLGKALFKKFSLSLLPAKGYESTFSDDPQEEVIVPETPKKEVPVETDVEKIKQLGIDANAERVNISNILASIKSNKNPASAFTLAYDLYTAKKSIEDKVRRLKVLNSQDAKIKELITLIDADIVAINGMLKNHVAKMEVADDFKQQITEINAILAKFSPHQIVA
jgi:hypothetical protein